ncbi:MAG: YciI family protein [Rhodospirillaceae bacterium]|jgi:uncharacterized protein YciI
MHFVIFCLDKPGITRDPAVMQAHVEYLNDSPIKNVMSGPLTGDDGEGVIGSLYVVEAESRQAIEDFQKDDPLVKADYWQTVEVRAFNKRVDNRD